MGAYLFTWWIVSFFLILRHSFLRQTIHSKKLSKLNQILNTRWSKNKVYFTTLENFKNWEITSLRKLKKANWILFWFCKQQLLVPIPTMAEAFQTHLNKMCRCYTQLILHSWDSPKIAKFNFIHLSRRVCKVSVTNPNNVI